MDLKGEHAHAEGLFVFLVCVAGSGWVDVTMIFVCASSLRVCFRLIHIIVLVSLAGAVDSDQRAVMSCLSVVVLWTGF